MISDMIRYDKRYDMIWYDKRYNMMIKENLQ
jgi:hypothetical protein